MKKIVLILLIMLGFTSTWGQTLNDFRSNVATGNWNALATWQRFDGTSWVAATVLPGATANNGNVFILDGHTVTITAAPTAAISSLTVGGGTSGALNWGGFAMTVTGATTIANGGTLTITSNVGLKTFTGDFTNNGTFTNTAGNSPVTFGGNFTQNGTINPGSGVYTFSGTTRTIGGSAASLAISNITISGTIANNIPLTSTGTVTISGTFTNNSTFSQTGTAVTIAGAGTLVNAATGSLNISGTSVTPTLTATAAGNTVTYTGTATQTVRGTTYSNLTINKASGTATLGAATTVSGNLTVTSGTLADGAFQITGNGTGLLSVANGATLQIGTGTATITSFPTLFTTTNISLGATSTVNYNTITNAQTVAASVTSVGPGAYGNLIITGGTGTKTAAANVTVAGNLTIATSGGIFATAANTVTVNGNISNAGSITSTGAGRILLTGGAAQHSLTGFGSYTNIELNDALGAINGAAFSILGVLTQTAGTWSIGSATTLTLSGTLAATGTGDFSGTTTSNLTIGGTGALGNTLRFASGGQNLGLLSISRTSGSFTMGSDLTVNTVGTALSMSGSTVVTLGNFNITLASGANFSGTGAVTNMIVADAAIGTGELRKTFAAATPLTFVWPIGDATSTVEYSPVSLVNFTATGGNMTIGVKVTDGIHPQMNSNGVQTNYITRFFTFSESGPATSYTYATNSYVQYVNSASDVVGTLSTSTTQLNRYDNGSATWFQLGSSLTAPQFLTTGTQTNVSGKLGNNDFTVRLNPSQTYTWLATTGSADWQTPTSWTPSRISPSSNDVLQFNLGGTSTATNVPAQTVAQILVDNNTDISLQAAATSTLTLGFAASTNVLSITSGSNLQLSSTGLVVHTLAFPALATLSTNIAGTITINANTGFNNTIIFTNLLAANNIITGTITNNGGVVTSTNLTTTFGSASTYNHARNGGSIPLATWNATSTCNITGITSTALTAFTGAFGNLTWNCPSQTIASPLTAASSVAGNLTVTAGSLSDGSFQITGNATGTLSVANNATLQIGTGGTGTVFPTNFTTGNITLSTGSTVIYGSSAAQNVAGLTYHHLTLTSSGTKTFVTAAPTINGNFAITGCTVNDNGFQIVGNATGTFTMSASASSILVLGTAATATAFPTNFVAGNITLSSPSVVRYNSNLNQTVSNVPTYSVLQLQSAAGTPTKTLAGNTLVTGSATPMVNIGTGNTFNLGGFNLTLQNSGSGTSPITNTGTISANTDGGSTITLTGTSHGFAPGTILTTARPNLVISVNAAQTVSISQATPQVALSNLTIGANNTLSLSAGAQLGIAGTYINNGTLTANTSGTTITLNGNSPQTFTVGTYTGSSIGAGTLATSGGLTINNTAGVSLGSALNVPVLTLTNGILTTTGTNLLTVTGTAVACVVGGTTANYVNGPLVRSFPASLVSGSTYTFPVGKANFNTFDLINPTTTVATTVRVEAFDIAAGGTDGIGFSSSPTPNRYWQASVPTGALTSGGTVRLLDASVTVDGNTVVGNSATQTGTYSPLGGTNPNAPSSGYITSTSTAPTALGFFKMGTRGCLSGTYTIGAAGFDFTNITSAISTLNGSQVCGNIIFELQTNYNGTSGETFPITINAANYSGGPWNIVVRPNSAVASNLTTSGSSTLQIFNFNGIDRLTFDGRPGGTGSTIRWVIANTSTSGQVIAFNNDATTDTLEYVQIEGVNTTVPGTGTYTNAGLVAFGNTAPSIGNENNVIDNCFIKDGATTPTNAIYSFGSSTANLGNDNNRITNNRLANVWAAAASTSFINLQNGNSAWTINSNSFNQTATRTGTTGTSTHTMILISNTSGNGFTINNNYIGGSGALATGTWTQTGIADARFNGMTLSVGSTTTTNVQGNVFGNIAWAGNGTATVNSAMFHAIYVTNGAINIGTTTGNIIGNATYPITITFNNTTISQAGTAYGIYNNSGNGQINIQNNTIGNITGAITATTSLNFSAIVFGAGTGSAPSRIINSNTISNITIAGASGSGGTSNLYGIVLGTGGASAGEIKNNTIFSLTNNYSGAAVGSQVVGIQLSNTPNAFTITGNTIYSLSCAATHASTTTSSAAIGISYSSSISSGHTISNNTIHTLSATATSAASNVIGIYFSPALSGSGNSIDGNLIHSLSLSTSSTAGTINGIYLNAGTATVSNNMIRLGINAAGGNLTTGYAINGINEIATLNNFYSNSVYIGGTGVASSTIPTYALLSAGTGTRAIQNNIFWNARSNSAGSAKHFAIRYATATGLTCSFNDILATGTGAVLGNIGGTDNTSLAALSSNSIGADPVFINATGNAASVDLHIQPSPAATPIEGIGVATPVLIDFDGQTRTSFTAEDIGADAGNFTPIDQTAPTVTIGTVSQFCNSATSVTFTATITDASGVNITAGTAPRVYFKKTTDANDLTGWKFFESTTGSSPFSFTIDFTQLNAGSVSAGESIQYFIVAQDQGVNVITPNVAITSGTFAATPTSVALTSAAFPIGGSPTSSAILPCQGTITVGTSGTDNYTSLTNTGGIFAAINATTLTGNLTVNITTDLTAETGTVALNQWAESGVGNYTVTFQSSAAANRVISGSYNGSGATTNGLVRLNGADRVTFNGGTGSQRFLTINNSGSGGNNAAFALLNGAQNNTINNCSFACGTFGANTANGVVFIGASVSSGAGGNSNNTITNNDIDNLTTFPLNGIYADGTSAIGTNTGNTINANNITDFYIVGGGSCGGITIATANTAFTITNNNIYQTANRISASPVDYYFIRIGINTTSGLACNGIGFTISGNKIGGTGRDGSGNITGAWAESNIATGHRYYGIMINQNTTTGNATTVENNVISGFNVTTNSTGNITSASAGAWNGIAVVSGNVNIGSVGNGNIIGSSTTNSAIIIEQNGISGPGNSAAIWVNGANTNVNTVGNTIAGIDITQTSTTNPHNFYGIYYLANNALTKNISNNAIGTTTTTGLIRSLTGADNQILAGILSSVSSGGTINISNNRISGLNANGGSTASATGRTEGIEVTGGSSNYNIQNNRIFNLTNQSFNNNALGTPSVVGIRFNGGGTQASIISGNTIYSLTHNTTSQNVSLTGIYFNGSSSTSNIISNNSIHSFEFTSTSNSASLFGIVTDGTSPATLSNNVIRLGIRPNGTSVPNSTVVTGIFDNSSAATSVLFNSVFTGGTSGSAQSSNSYAYRRNVNSGADIIRNNIFANDRTGGGSGSLHFAFATNTTNGLVATNFDNNIFYSRNNTEFSINNGTANLSAALTTALRLQAMRAAAPLGNNLRSGVATLAQINFVNATGDSSAVNLRLNADNCAVGAGLAISTINTDGFGNTRSTTGAVAIGAHEGSFNTMLANNDIYTPNFSFTAIPTQPACGGSSTTNVDVTVTDIGTGVPTTGSVPVMWWRQSLPTATTWAPVSGVLQSGNGNNGVFRFTITNTYAIGQTYEYYFVADDQATNTALSPAGINRWYSSYTATTPVVNLTTQTTPPSPVSNFSTNSVNPLSGTVTVGTSGTYATFNGTGGLFDAINTRGLGGNLQVNVISDVSELANWTPLIAFTEYCGSNYTVTISPSSATIRTIETNTSAANPMFSFYGVQRLVIDGRFGGSGRFLRLRHNRVTPSSLLQPTVEMNNSTRNSTIRNCIIEGGNNSLNTNTAGDVGTLMIGASMGFGNGTMRNITIQENLFQNNSNIGSPTLAHIPMYHIWMGGASSSANIRAINIINNDITNFQASAISASNGVGQSTNSIGDSITITGNNIYQTLTGINTYQYPIEIDALGLTKGHVISNNKIGGTGRDVSGNITGTWLNTLSDGELIGIFANVDNAPTGEYGVTIDGNIISNINLSGTSWGNFIGIRVLNGKTRVNNNLIGSLASSLTTPNIICAGNGGLGLTDNTMVAGIWTQSTEEVEITNNTICGLSSTSGFSFMDGIAHGSNLYFNGILFNTPGGKATITGNRVLFSRSSSRLQNLAIPSPEGFMGIFCWTNQADNLIADNEVRNCGSGTSISPRNVRIHGMFVGVYGSTTAQTGIIERNRIQYLFNENTGDGTSTINPIIFGLSIANGDWTIRNNSIFLNNGTQSGSIISSTNTSIRGINDGMLFNQANCEARYYNNTVVVSGTNSGSPANSSAAFLRFPLDYGSTSITAGAPITLRNNIFINNRGGTGNHRAIWNNATSNANATVNWNSSTSNYNFLAAPSSSNIALWGTSANLDLANWRTTSGGDNNSWSVATATSSSNTQVNPTDLFINATGTGVANLNINPANQAAWFVNGKGVAGSQVGSLNTDFDGTARGTTFGYGIDIGADEFTPNTGVLPHTLTATPSLGGTNTFTFAGRTIGSINWINQGTVPTSIACQYYSGVTPGGAPSPAYGGANAGNFMYDFTPTGGTGYRYQVVMNYDPALAGTYVGNQSLMKSVKTGPNLNNWFEVSLSVNPSTFTLTTTDTLTRFSFFGAGESFIPLPITLLSFNAKPNGENVDVTWVTASEENNDFFTIERSSNGEDFSPIGIVDGAGNSNTTLSYLYVDQAPLPGLSYYRLKQTDYNGAYEYSSPVAVMFNGKNQAIVNAYVNTEGNIEGVLSLSAAQNVALTLTDVQGKVIAENTVVMQKGINRSIVAGQSLAAGVYILRAETQQGVLSIKIVKP